MALLRKITKPKWYDSPSLPAGAIQADALVDLRTQNNELSVWRIEPGASNLNAVVAALASNRTQRVANLDYVLLDDEVLTALGIQCIKSDGDSPHTDANSTWHCDLVHLTAMKVVELAQEVKRRAPQHKRLQPGAVRDVLKAALQAGALRRDAVTVELLEELEAPTR